MIPTLLQRYILRETLRVALISFVALTGIIFVGISVSLMRAGLGITQLGGMIRYLIAFSLPYALPCSMLVASVFVFGRLSGQNEITAIKCSGVNLNHIFKPLLVIALLLSVMTFMLNHFLLPWSKIRIRTQRNELLNQLIAQVGRCETTYDLGKYVVYIGGTDQQGWWEHVAVMEFAKEFPTRIMIAQKGYCRLNEDRTVVTFWLYNGVMFEPKLGDMNAQSAVKFAKAAHSVNLEEEDKALSDKPKYLPLTPWNSARGDGVTLLSEIDKYEETVAAIRRLPGYRKLKHPKMERKRAERELRSKNYEINQLRINLEERMLAVNEARNLLSKANEEQRIAQAEFDIVARRRTELENRFVEITVRHSELQAELAEMMGWETDAERVLQQQEEILAVVDQLQEIGAQYDTTDSEWRRKQTRLEDARAEVAKCQERQNSAEAKAQPLNPLMAAAQADYRKSFDHVQRVRDVQRLLRLKTAFHFRNAASLTSPVFLLIGIPLGILSRRGNVILAFAISFFAVLMIYYPLMIVSQVLSRDGYVTAWIGQWIPNLFVGGLGVILSTRGIRR